MTMTIAMKETELTTASMVNHQCSGGNNCQKLIHHFWHYLYINLCLKTNICKFFLNLFLESMQDEIFLTRIMQSLSMEAMVNQREREPKVLRWLRRKLLLFIVKLLSSTVLLLLIVQYFLKNYAIVVNFVLFSKELCNYCQLCNIF